MRIRTIKPEFWRSADIAGLSREHRLLFIGLLSYVDDNGVGVDDNRAIAADLFAFEEDPHEARDFVREGLATLSRQSLLLRYEVDGKHYLFITGWDKHQRVDKPGKPRYPRPVGRDDEAPTSGDNPESLDEGAHSRERRESVAPGTEEQRNRGTVKNLRTADAQALVDAQFDEFWKAYPRKVDKRRARSAFAAALKRGADPVRLIAAAESHARQRWNQDPKYTKHPATWLNAGSFENEPHLLAVPGPPRRAVDF